MDLRIILRMAGLVLAVSLLAACSPESSDKSKPIAKIGDYTITEDEFRRRIVATRKLFDEDALTYEDKKRYLDREIDKELLIEEARKLRLAREPEFLEATQRFWEQTLITRLFEVKVAKLVKHVFVTDQEVRQRYAIWCKEDPNCPELKEAREKLQAEVLQEKKQKALDEWLSDLRKKASVTIYEDNLRALK